MRAALLAHVSEFVGSQILHHQPVSGGDISAVYRLDTSLQTLLIKVSDDRSAKNMFRAEQTGLDAIRKTDTVRVPEIFGLGQFEQTSFLIMEFVDSRKARSEDYALLGQQLAQLHENSTTLFGWPENNFIGSLPQSNDQTENWSLFYVEQRLLPQIELAKVKGLISDFDRHKSERMKSVCKDLLPPVPPALLHGDLWSGNYLISADGIPYLIDPSVYFGHSEIDLAMTRLFGGFSDAFYAAYAECKPPQPGMQERIDLYQLYYLLVHLNLFGISYYGSVEKILDRYF
ncbi:MAG: phosphotransferase [Saprospiraceae bacterium]|nr:phosphotransferase [Saprospiraceae bacterium]